MSAVPGDLDVWILAGQSNMQGVGLFDDPTLPPMSAPDARVWSFSSEVGWAVAAEPLHPVPSASPRGTGLGIAFGAAVAQTQGRAVGLIPAARGGTSLRQWDPDAGATEGASLYGTMLARSRQALDGTRARLRGVLWYQGESDANAHDASTYEERLERLLAAMRRDLRDPELPIHLVQICRYLSSEADADAWDLVRESQRRVAESTAHVTLTSAVDLQLADIVHLDTRSLQRLGRRLARQVASGGPGPRVVRVERGPRHANGIHSIRVITDGAVGGWSDPQTIDGFEVRTADGEPHPELAVYTAHADVREPTVIHVVIGGRTGDGTGAQFDPTMRLGYGLGTHPRANAVDAVDMPLPAFAPMPIVTPLSGPRVGEGSPPV